MEKDIIFPFQLPDNTILETHITVDMESVPELLEMTVSTVAVGACTFPAVCDVTTTKNHLPKEIFYPLDAVNGKIWYDEYEFEEGKNYKVFNVDTHKSGTDDKAFVKVAVKFEKMTEGISMSEKLTNYDKLICILIEYFYWNGKEYITPTMIYHLLNPEGKPNPSDIQKINNSVTKLSDTRIWIDNEKEYESYKKYGHIVIDGPAIHMERLTRTVDGKTEDIAIRIVDEPPLMKFARIRNHMDVMPLKALQIPVRKTDINLLIANYLLVDIMRMKSPNNPRNNIILLNKVFSRCGLTGSRQRDRKKKTVLQLLDYYKECGFIDGYENMVNEEKVRVLHSPKSIL